MDKLENCLQQIQENVSGNALNPPWGVKDKLEWYLQQFHEYFSGEFNTVPPNPVPDLDVLGWWLRLLYDDILNGVQIPWRFKLINGELILLGENVPVSFNLNSGTGELTVDDSELPAGFTNWWIEDGRLYADEV